MQDLYFQPAESKETLTGIFKDSAKIEQRTYTYTTGAIYAGQWRGWMRHGQGSMIWADGAQYEGEWSFNAANGYGIFIYADGVHYKGQFLLDKKEGFGIYTCKDGRKYEGWFHKDKQHGLGKNDDPNKCSLKFGLWENGKHVRWYDDQ